MLFEDESSFGGLLQVERRSQRYLWGDVRFEFSKSNASLESRTHPVIPHEHAAGINSLSFASDSGSDVKANVENRLTTDLSVR